MAGKSRAVEYGLLRWLTGQATSTFSFTGITPWLALFTAAPSDTGGGTEVSTVGTGYGRVNTSGKWGAPSGAPGSVASNASIAFGTVTSGWGSCPYFGLFDASSGGNLLAWGSVVANNVNNTLVNGYGSAAPAGYSDYPTGATEAQVYGLRFTPTETISATGARLFRSNNAGVKTTHDFKLWTDAGVLMQQKASSGESSTHVWVPVTFDTPQTLVAGTYYVASVYYPNTDAYVYLWHGFDSGKAMGVLTAPANAGRASVLQPGAHVFPSSTGFNNGEYFIDITYTRPNQPIVTGDQPYFASGAFVLNED